MDSEGLHKIRHLIFLRDVFVLTFMAIGGPHAHLPLFLDRFVTKRKYLTEAELLELHALCQILPGPTSTQTITAIGFKLGKAKLAYLTVLIWSLPSILIMSGIAIFISKIDASGVDLTFMKILEPMAVGFMYYAAFKLIRSVIHTNFAWLLLVLSTSLSIFFRSPYFTPLLISIGAIAAGLKNNGLSQPNTIRLKIDWSNFFLFVLIFVSAFVLGLVTQSKLIKLFESFYRNGSMVFGGGQVLIPMLHSEYVDLKRYLTSDEFLMGYTLIQAVPGPLFSISSYIGALAYKEQGALWMLLGSIVSSLGIFLPGTLLIFFVAHFWSQLKKSKIVIAALEGVNAVSAGMVLGVAIYLTSIFEFSWQNFIISMLTALVMISGRVHIFLLIGAGLLAGYLFNI